MEMDQEEQCRQQHSVADLLKGIPAKQILSEHKVIVDTSKEVFQCDTGAHGTNMDKNRWKFFLPYDHSRVVLTSSDNDGDGDYINANYIPDYLGNKKAFIATQGPLESTVSDFWRMVWQTGANRIVMVTNRKEEDGEVTLCAKYWPDIGSSKRSGNLTVEILRTEKHPEYVIRFFRLSAASEEREILQFHYLGWPDHSVPHSTGSILRFWQGIQRHNPTATSPLIIHCSAGVGRTGTYLALDQAIRQARATGQVGLCGYVISMRKERIKMLQNKEQYVFAYAAVRHALQTEHILTGDIQKADFGPVVEVPAEDDNVSGSIDDREASR